MPTRVLKPTSPGVRDAVWLTSRGITQKKPHRSLLTPLKKRAGRNAQGRITVRHRGGGSKRKYRIIDFRRDKLGIPGIVATIEYDPNRSSLIALINYVDGDKRYILAPLGLEVGAKIMAGPQADIKPGNALPLSSIPGGTLVHNIELNPGRGAQMVRSAGTAAQVMTREAQYVLVRLPSGGIRKVLGRSQATIGQVGNSDHKNVKLGKAGKIRHQGRRPQVRGSAMSPRDHPHGGGEGRSPIGMAGPKTPWGKPALGLKTRRKGKASTRLIIRRRK